MYLTEEQKDEIKNYIVTVPRFRETYDELYDHILNALENTQANFSIDEVTRIVNRDFYGFYEIVHQEKIYQKQLSKKYNRYFQQAMLNTFKWPGILNNLGAFFLCLLIYFGSEAGSFNIKPMLMAILILVIGIAVFGFSKILYNRYKYAKYSILDNYFGYSCSFGFVMVSASLHFLNKEDAFEIGDNARLALLLSLYFFCAIYVRAFREFYKLRVKILTA